MLLRGEWEGAVRAIMAGGPDERREYGNARKRFLETGDAQVGVIVRCIVAAAGTHTATTCTDWDRQESMRRVICCKSVFQACR